MVGNGSSKAPVSFGKLLGTFRFGWATAGCSTFLLPIRAALTHAEIERISSALNVVTTSSPLFRAEGLLASKAIADVDSITNDNAGHSPTLQEPFTTAGGKPAGFQAMVIGS